mmetsp:Transcript_58927/g.140167  ORF Transcript_58927/g.140167 Transcript_58927/m.140167 type:complete len:96 (-) Transcript_58927:9-296(-)
MGKHSWWKVDEGTALLWTIRLIIGIQVFIAGYFILKLISLFIGAFRSAYVEVKYESTETIARKKQAARKINQDKSEEDSEERLGLLPNPMKMHLA